MPNLIGTGNNQVPTNGMLGGMAYQSPDSVVIKNLELTNLAGHNSLIPSTAVDVFVYDTRKDSDGGAWRYRTQNTSWYNETLNTATRGSRREFPTVAVIVAESFKVTIYDGDDPDMPMWMVLSQVPGLSFIQDGYYSLASCVSALNGILSVGIQATGEPQLYGGFVTLNFAKDIGFKYGGPHLFYSGRGSAGTKLRDTISTSWYQVFLAPSTFSIINGLVSDVAMTVLPNAPIDPSTSLPIPTIAVATAGGVSVIRDDGTIVNPTNLGCGRVLFDINGNLHCTGHNNQLWEISKFSYTTKYSGQFLSPIFFGPVVETLSGFATSGQNYSATENFQRLDIIATSDKSFSSGSSGLRAHVATNYNTGYQFGDIKGAWLSDTSTTSVTGTELITNGTFATDVTGWTASTSTNTWSSGTMQITRSGGSGQATYQAFTTVAGQRYVATATVNSSGSRGDLYIINGTGWGGTQIGFTNGTSGQTRQLTVYFTATSTTTTLAFAVDQNGTSIIVDNVSVRAEEPDRSVNNKGLQVFGTITKTAVATGADLVAYSGFSASNYLQQPYNSALDFGTNPFSVMVWFKTPTGGTGTEVLLSWRDLVGSNPLWQVYLSGTSNISFDFQGTQNGGSTFSNPLRDNTWHLLTAVQRSVSLREFYIDSNLVATNTTTLSPGFTVANAVLKVGVHYDNNYAYTGSLSLLRISASAPSAEQIKKIYDDEKVLFQENAKATLYGASNAVTALAYDDTTKLLHVGTSSGRSDFQGLRRINNTTTAVTTAISASNGLIAEQ